MPRTAPLTHRIRIIGGRWKRTPLPVPDVAGLRPTPDRVRETLFNWIGPSVEGSTCLDLFAGSAALSFEAASRGAQRVVCVERDRSACDAIRKTIEKLDARMIELRQGEALSTARALIARGDRFDLVFLDPPFREGWVERALPLSVELLSATGRIYVESQAALDAKTLDPLGIEIHRCASAGQVHYHLLHKRAD